MKIKAEKAEKMYKGQTLWYPGKKAGILCHDKLFFLS